MEVADGRPEVRRQVHEVAEHHLIVGVLEPLDQPAFAGTLRPLWESTSFAETPLAQRHRTVDTPEDVAVTDVAP